MLDALCSHSGRYHCAPLADVQTSIARLFQHGLPAGFSSCACTSRCGWRPQHAGQGAHVSQHAGQGHFSQGSRQAAARHARRDQARRAGSVGEAGSLLDTRVRSAFQAGAVDRQPAGIAPGYPLRTSRLSDCVERHFRLLHSTRRPIALAIEVDRVGAALEQGLGVRSQLYRARHEAPRRPAARHSADELGPAAPGLDADRLAHAPAVC